MALVHESGEFIFGLPLWALVHRSIADKPTDFSKLIMGECADGRLVVHLFTDEDLAERFARAQPGAVPREIQTVIDAMGLLGSLAKIGCHFFSFDAVDERHVLPLPIDQLRETLKQYPG